MNTAPTVHVSDIVAAALLQHTDLVFGLMGNGNAWLCDALAAAGRGIVPVRHEVTTVAAADAYHRVTARLAAATTTYGPGYTNTLTALAEAAMSRTPLIYAVGSAPSTGPRDWDIDQASVTAALGASTFTVGPDDAGETMTGALAHALRERVPVVVEIPYDLAATPVTPKGAIIPELPAAPAPPELTDEAARRIAGLLRGAQRPLILAGRGARPAAEEIRALAAQVCADVATTAPARGLFAAADGDEKQYRDLGVCGGFASEWSAEQIHAADVVVVFGAGLNQFTMAFGEIFGPAATVIQIDLAQAATHRRVDEFHPADARDAARRVCAILPSAGVPRPDRPGRAVAPAQTRPAGDALAPDGRLDPRSLMIRLNRALPADRLVASDGGHFIGWANMYFDLPAADSIVLLGTAFQSIGLGFPTAVGVAAAAGERTTVLVTGDGGGLMGIADAETFVRTAHRGVVVIINDAAYGAEIHQYATKGLNREPMLIPEVNFAGVLSALGARSAVIRKLDDLNDFEDWLVSGETGTYALDCRVSQDVIAPYMREMAGI